MAHKIVSLEEEEYSIKHSLFSTNGDIVVLCTYATLGDGCGVPDNEFKVSTVQRGGITCVDCLDIIKRMKAIKL